MSNQPAPRQRRFAIGDEFEVGGISFRCVEGKKGVVAKRPFTDIRLEWWVNGGWTPVIIDTLLAAFDVIQENEDYRYPHPADGGEKTLRAFRMTRLHGWQREVDKLQRERQSYQERMEAEWFNQDRDQGGAAS